MKTINKRGGGSPPREWVRNPKKLHHPQPQPQPKVEVKTLAEDNKPYFVSQVRTIVEENEHGKEERLEWTYSDGSKTEFNVYCSKDPLDFTYGGDDDDDDDEYANEDGPKWNNLVDKPVIASDSSGEMLFVF